MAQDASHDDVKRAYLDQALRFRADRNGNVESARERAEFRLHEIDAAWAVLRNPAARARYDDELRAEAQRPVAAGATTVAGVWVGEAPLADALARHGVRTAAGVVDPRQLDRELEASAATLEPAGAEPPPAPRRVRWAPVLVGAAALLVVLGWAGIATRKDPEAVRVKVVEEFDEGTCVGEDSSSATLLAVPCSDPAARLVVARSAQPVTCPTTRQLSRFVGGTRPYVCIEPARR